MLTLSSMRYFPIVIKENSRGGLSHCEIIGLDDLSIERLELWYPSRLRLRAFSLAAFGLNPSAIRVTPTTQPVNALCLALYFCYDGAWTRAGVYGSLRWQRRPHDDRHDVVDG
jgi:hypothetical protein